MAATPAAPATTNDESSATSDESSAKDESLQLNEDQQSGAAGYNKDVPSGAVTAPSAAKQGAPAPGAAPAPGKAPALGAPAAAQAPPTRVDSQGLIVTEKTEYHLPEGPEEFKIDPAKFETADSSKISNMSLSFAPSCENLTYIDPIPVPMIIRARNKWPSKYPTSYGPYTVQEHH